MKTNKKKQNFKGAFDDVCAKADYVFHVASPYVVAVEDPQRDLVTPAVEVCVFFCFVLRCLHFIIFCVLFELRVLYYIVFAWLFFFV